MSDNAWINWLGSRLEGPRQGSSVTGAALAEASRASFLLATGLVLGGAVVIAGGFLGALIDTGSRRFDAASYGLILVAIPVIGYAVAIAYLRVARRRLHSTEEISREGLARTATAISRARGAIAVALVPSAFFALFGGLALIGPADTHDNGAAVSALAGIGAAWVFLIAAIIALSWVSSARKLTPALISDDGNWWWDGLSWRPVPTGAGLSTQMVQIVPPHQQPAGAAYRQAVVAYSTTTNGPAVISGVAGIASWTVCPFVGSIAAVVTGHMALAQIRKRRESGRVWALIGLILGYLGVAFWCVLGVLVLLSTSGIWR